MAFSLTWLPQVLLDSGVKVAEVVGWQNRGRAEMGRVLGVMIHHTVGSATGNMPSLKSLVNGRGGPKPLAGPLAQLGLGRDGTWYVVAAGLANHAGEGEWLKVRSGNDNFIGIECENTGLKTDMPWPDAQMTSLRHGVAALLRHAGRSADWCCGHREYAPTRKIDPLWDVAAFRAELVPLLPKTGMTLPPIPAAETGVTTPRPTLRRDSPSNNPQWVKALQRCLHLTDDGIFGAETEAKVRAFQIEHKLVGDGIVGPKTWAFLPHE